MYALVVTCTRTCIRSCNIEPSQSPLCCLWQLPGSQGGREEQNCPLLQSQHASALYAEAGIRTFFPTAGKPVRKNWCLGISGVATQGHAGARALATSGRAPATS